MKYSEKSCHFTEGIVELITSEENLHRTTDAL